MIDPTLNNLEHWPILAPVSAIAVFPEKTNARLDALEERVAMLEGQLLQLTNVLLRANPAASHIHTDT